MAVSINFYEKFVEFFGDNTIDLDTHVFDIILMDVNHTFDATDTVKAEIAANELDTDFGYVQGAKTLASITWAESGGTTTWDFATVTWSASGGEIAATDAVVYDEGAGSDELVCSIDFDGLQTAGDGTDFIITPNGSGVFTIS